MNANPCNNSDFEILLRVHGHIHKTWWWSIWKHLESVLLHKRAHLNNVINKLYQYFFKILSVETSPLYILMLTYVFYYLLLFILCHLHYKPPGQPVFPCTHPMPALVRFVWRSVFDHIRPLSIFIHITSYRVSDCSWKSKAKCFIQLLTSFF